MELVSLPISRCGRLSLTNRAGRLVEARRKKRPRNWIGAVWMPPCRRWKATLLVGWIHALQCVPSAPLKVKAGRIIEWRWYRHVDTLERCVTRVLDMYSLKKCVWKPRRRKWNLSLWQTCTGASWGTIWSGTPSSLNCLRGTRHPRVRHLSMLTWAMNWEALVFLYTLLRKTPKCVPFLFDISWSIFEERKGRKARLTRLNEN